MTDFTDWTQEEMARRASIADIEAEGSLLVKKSNLFSRDYDGLAQGSLGQFLESQGSLSAPAFVNPPHTIQVINGGVPSLVIGTPVYIDGGQVYEADASTITKSHVVGLVLTATIAGGFSGIIQITGSITATTGQWDAVTPDTGGLVAGSRYYLNNTGGLTRTVQTVTGYTVTFTGIALSTTVLLLSIQPPILL